MSKWYDKQGRVLCDFSWEDPRWKKAMARVESLLTDKEYKIIKQDKLWWGGFLSTVWLGLDHNYGFGPYTKPLIFETMLFRNWRGDSVMQDRYSTLKEAEEHHEYYKRKYSNPAVVLSLFIRRLHERVSDAIHRRHS